MLRFLTYRENGTDDPNVMLGSECTRRAVSLALSRQFNTESVHRAGINCLDLDPVDGQYLLSSGADGTISIHNMENLSGEPKYTYPKLATIDRKTKGRHKFSCETVQWYPLDTGMFMSSGMDKLLKVWDTNELTIADEYKFSSNVYCHDMSQIAVQHSLIAVACQSAKVNLIDIKAGAATHTLKGHKMAVLCVKWSPRDEYLVATGSEDSKVMLWDIRSAKGSMMVLDQHNGKIKGSREAANTAHNGLVNGLAFTPDGLRLLTMGTDNHVRLWSTSTGANTNVNFGKVYNDCRKCVRLCTSAHTSPGLVYVPHEGHIEMFNAQNGDKIDTLRGHYNQVNSCLYDADKQELYSAGSDRNILVWTPLTSAVEAYEDHVTDQKNGGGKTQVANFTRRVGAMADTWSSDED